MSENPWTDPEIARKQRELVDGQLQQPQYQQHFRAFAESIRATSCPGSILELGCASGYGREILDRAEVPYRSYGGIDVSAEAIRMAKERYPESQWFCNDGATVWTKERGVDIVVDGSLVLHVDAWKSHLTQLCETSRRWVILHRIPLNDGTTYSKPTRGYGHEFPAWNFGRQEVVETMRGLGFHLQGELTADADTSTLTFAKPRHWVTYADGRYLTRLKALHASMVRHCGPFALHVLCWDEEVRRWADATAGVIATPCDDFLERHTALEVGQLPGPPRSVVEHYWTCGPQFVADVMAETGEPVTYVDADVMFHSSPEPMFGEIGGAAAGIVPHGFAKASQGLPGPTVETHSPFGTYNVGVVHFGQPIVALDWADKCRQWCYDRVEEIEAEGGRVPISDRRLRYGDQKFIDDWPRVFKAHVIEHPGAALGPWAVHTRSLDVRDGVIHFGNRPLVAYHYSSLRELPDGHSVPTRPEYRLTARQEEIIYRPYYAALKEAKNG